MFRKIVIRVLLFPLAMVYGLIVFLIHFFYDSGILKSSKFSIPVIGVGNMSVGGAGKTPHIEYLIELLAPYIDIATLSRGYNRNTRGFRLVQYSDTALTVGDEPIQFRRKYRDLVVAVSESRAYAIPRILQQYPGVQTILLDDAFQHRSVLPGLQILLTAYDSMFTKDYLLPAGRLREWRSGYRRADIIIVSKCPPQLAESDRQRLLRDIHPLSHQRVYFSFYTYGYPYSLYDSSKRIMLDETLDVLLLSAIANTDYLYSYLEDKVASIHEVEYTDHHFFNRYDIEKITRVFKSMVGSKKIILTTEKDAMRLEMQLDSLRQENLPVFVLPVRVQFHGDDQKLFDADMRRFLLGFEV
jgi:tetraacyldisaccharide 4'-kinase